MQEDVNGHDSALAEIDDLDATATLHAEAEDQRLARRLEVRRMQRMLHYCDLHTGDPQDQPAAVPVSRGGDRLIRIGGDGTPEVADLCLPEYAIARRTGVIATQNYAADCLDLRHRLPRLWTAVQQLRVEGWVARKIARFSKSLTLHAGPDRGPRHRCGR